MREMQTKAEWETPLTTTRMATVKQQLISVGDDVEKLKLWALLVGM